MIKIPVLCILWWGDLFVGLVSKRKVLQFFFLKAVEPFAVLLVMPLAE